MPAYVIVETDIHDPEQYEQYKAASPAAVHGGGRLREGAANLRMVAVQGLDESL